MINSGSQYRGMSFMSHGQKGKKKVIGVFQLEESIRNAGEGLPDQESDDLDLLIHL